MTKVGAVNRAHYTASLENAQEVNPILKDELGFAIRR